METTMTLNTPIISKEQIEDLNRRVNILELKEGGNLAYYEYGDVRGKPILFFHGTGSHIHVMLLHEAALEMGYRVIVPDRPGVGLSDFKKGWTLLKSVGNYVELLDILKVDKCIAMGISGGGPSLMACAHTIPERIEMVIGLACAMPLYRDKSSLKTLGTMDRFYARVGGKLPLVLFRIPFSLLGLMQTVMKSPNSFAKMMSSSMCASDARLFSDPNLQYLFMRDFQELFRRGSKGPAYDAQLVYKDWGFDLADIKTRIEIFHGTEDKWVPIIFSEYLAKKAPCATLHSVQNEGHFYHLVYAQELLQKISRLGA